MKRLIFDSSKIVVGILVVSMMLIFPANVPAKNYVRLIDRVTRTIENLPENITHLRVKEQDGEVEIHGTVNNLYDKLNIFDAVSKIRGVREISDDLNIKVAGMVPDKEIQANTMYELRLVKSILEPNRIKVHVNNGVIFLSGNVSYYKEKLMAETVASWQNGALGIQDNIKVLPPKIARSDENISKVLYSILGEDFPLDKSINVEVNHGVVTINGDVQTLWDKKQIKDDFSRVLGVKDIINKLDVNYQVS